jgi:hypothetical protein
MLAIILQNQTYILPKEWIRSNLPGSLLDSALQDDPEATELMITHPDVSPESLQILVNLAKGLEPEKHSPSLALAHRYLNIPGLLYYTDPLYDQIPNRQDITNAVNKPVFDTAIDDNHSLIVGYYLLKGLIPTDAMLRQAVWAGATNVVKVLLMMGNSDPSVAVDYALREAASLGHAEIVELLLADTRVDPTVYECECLVMASKYGHVEVVKVLLADSRVGLCYNAIRTAAQEGQVEILALFLADARIGSRDIQRALYAALDESQSEIVALIQADPRYQPAWLTVRPFFQGFIASE